jgi:UDP-N-acetylmuramyl pentapeptide phosphotransferase/UDP-N-acetylglucosamine-1-phosphate transferase
LDTAFIGFLRENKPFLTLLLPFGITFFLLPPLGRLASRIGLVDHPGGRKIHLKQKPLVGGLAMSLAVAIIGLLFIPLSISRKWCEKGQSSRRFNTLSS